MLATKTALTTEAAKAIAAVCEAIAFAKKLGLDIDRVFEVITKSAGNGWMFENRIPHVHDGDYTPRSAVSIFARDLGIVTELGRREKFAPHRKLGAATLRHGRGRRNGRR